MRELSPQVTEGVSVHFDRALILERARNFLYRYSFHHFVVPLPHGGRLALFATHKNHPPSGRKGPTGVYLRNVLYHKFRTAHYLEEQTSQKPKLLMKVLCATFFQESSKNASPASSKNGGLSFITFLLKKGSACGIISV